MAVAALCVFGALLLQDPPTKVELVPTPSPYPSPVVVEVPSAVPGTPIYGGSGSGFSGGGTTTVIQGAQGPQGQTGATGAAGTPAKQCTIGVLDAVCL